MDKGDIFTMSINGSPVTVCVIDNYQEESSGERMVVLALIKQENVLRIPARELEPLLSDNKRLN